MTDTTSDCYVYTQKVIDQYAAANSAISKISLSSLDSIGNIGYYLFAALLKESDRSVACKDLTKY